MGDTETACELCGAHGDVPHAWVEGTCILPHRYDKNRHPPLAEVGHCCIHCVGQHRQNLTEIVELYAGLENVLAGERLDVGDVADHKRPKKQPAAPAPIRRLEAWSMLFDSDRLYARGPRRDDRSFAEDYIHTATPDIPAVLDGWVDCLYEALGYSDSLWGTVAACANTLATYAEFIAAQPWVDDYDAELRWLGIALRRVHGISNPRPVAECLNTEKGGECHGLVWRPDPDDGKGLRCDKCGRRYKGLDMVRLKAHKGRRASA